MKHCSCALQFTIITVYKVTLVVDIYIMDITHLLAVLALLVAPMQILANGLVNICQHTVYSIYTLRYSAMLTRPISVAKFMGAL